MKNNDIRIKNISDKKDQLYEVDLDNLPELPYPYHDWEDPPIEEIQESKREKYDSSLD